MREITVETTTHGRVLLEDAAVSFDGDGTHADTGADSAAGLIVCFHGYGEAAEEALAEARQIPGAPRWHIASVQALNRFYTRRDEKVVANWMTRQDREQAIADNVAYVDRVVAEVQGDGSQGDGGRGDGGRSPQGSSVPLFTSVPLVFLGFSQGAAMAYRAAVLGRHRAAGVIALAGDIPPELTRDDGIERGRPWPAVLIGAGGADQWFTPAKVDADESFLEARGIRHQVARFAGGHEWTEEFRQIAGEWLRHIDKR